jgi:hypothetical protein
MNNFVIARFWEDNRNSLCVYRIFNNDVHYGDEEYAENLLKIVSEKNKDDKYEIFWLNTDRDIV